MKIKPPIHLIHGQQIMAAMSLCVAVLMLATRVHAAITYVDATSGTGGNTTLTNGLPWNPLAGTQGSAGDGLWALRTGLGNSGTIYQNAASSTSDDAHPLLTTVSGLPPGRYNVFAYFWADTSSWRMRAGLSPDNLPLFQFNPLSPGVTNYAVQNGSTIQSDSLSPNPFTTAVMIAEANRVLNQAYLGQVTGSEIRVYLDDGPAADANQRTWYDGIGYALVSLLSPPDTGYILPVLTNHNLIVIYRGTAGRQYAQETAASLTPPVGWTATRTNTADASGLVNFTNTPSPAQAYFRVRDVTLPGAVANLTAAAGAEQVSLSWSPASLATSYNVKRATNSGGSYTVFTNVTTTSCVNTGLVNGTTYYFVVSAINPNGEGADSSEVSATPALVSDKPRVINTTDLGADVDDRESLVRMLVTANEYDLEGIIGVSSCWYKNQTWNNVATLLNPILNAYGQVLTNLQVHASGYPSLAYLQSITKLGNPGYGMAAVGAGKDSPGSDLIIAAVDKNDPRPVWVNLWGGANTVAQALWKVQNTRTPEQVAQFVSKLRVYDVLGQDEAGAWITKTFPNLLYIRFLNVYSWQPSDTWVANNIQNHGPLGAVYPDRKYATEGDTPAFLYQYPNGLSDPGHVDWGGWGGRCSLTQKAGVRGMSAVTGEAAYDPYYMYSDASEGGSSISRWSTAINNDFAARMDWSITNSYAAANHHPIAVVNGNTTKQVLQLSAAAGSNVALSAAGSSDPDGDALVYWWFHYVEPSSYKSTVTIQNSATAAATVQIPANAGGQSIHVILELHDNGSPNLYAYRRVIINVE